MDRNNFVRHGNNGSFVEEICKDSVLSPAKPLHPFKIDGRSPDEEVENIEQEMNIIQKVAHDISAGFSKIKYARRIRENFEKTRTDAIALKIKLEHNLKRKAITNSYLDGVKQLDRNLQDIEAKHRMMLRYGKLKAHFGAVAFKKHALSKIQEAVDGKIISEDEADFICKIVENDFWEIVDENEKTEDALLANHGHTLDMTLSDLQNESK